MGKVEKGVQPWTAKTMKPVNGFVDEKSVAFPKIQQNDVTAKLNEDMMEYCDWARKAREAGLYY